MEIISGGNTGTVALCEISGPEARMADGQNLPPFKTNNPKRIAEWASACRLLRFVFNKPLNYSYDKSGRPVLADTGYNLSIAHSAKYVAIAVSPVYIPGLDIEEITPRIHRIQHKFVNRAEESWLAASGDKTTLLYLIWCSKEAVYKATGIKPDFREHIFIEPSGLSDNGRLNVNVSKENYRKKLAMNYKITDRYVVTWVMNEQNNI